MEKCEFCGELGRFVVKNAEINTMCVNCRNRIATFLLIEVTNWLR
jgi:hypothetical protein